MTGLLQSMVTVVIDQVRCRNITQRAKPLGTSRTNPDEVAGCDPVPVLAQSSDSTARKDQDTTFRSMYLNSRRCGTRLIRHGIYDEVEGLSIGDKSTNLDKKIPKHRGGSSGTFPSDK